MRSINKVILIGNLTRDPELRQTNNGQNVTTFGIATNREWMTKEGDKKNSAEFHECVAWAKLAEICDQYLVKGNLVYVEGYLKTRSWDSPEGIKKFKTEIVVKDMIRLEKRAKDLSTKDLSKDNPEYIPTEESSNNTEESPQEDTTVNVEEIKEEENLETVAVGAEETPTTEENPIDKDLGL